MTPGEIQQLEALRISVEEGFREMRGLVEDRRKEDNAAHIAIYSKMEANRLELADKVDEVRQEQASVKESLDGSKAVRRWMYGAAGLLAAWVAAIVAAAPFYLR